MKLAVQTHGMLEMLNTFQHARARTREGLRKVMFRQGNEMVRIIQNEFRGAAETTPTSTARRTGALWRSYRAQLTEDANTVGVDVGVLRGAEGNALEYAALHEYGGTITPKNGQYLAIPLGAAKTKRGVGRGGPRDYGDDLIVIRSKRGNLLLVRRPMGKAVGIEPLFVLVKSVKIKARPSLRPAVNRVRAVTEHLAAAAVRAALARAA